MGQKDSDHLIADRDRAEDWRRKANNFKRVRRSELGELQAQARPRSQGFGSDGSSKYGAELCKAKAGPGSTAILPPPRERTRKTSAMPLFDELQ